ncbi:hypothetical protein F4775DRAFT_537336 [Biscogniauxia sp. FL1348]|nr:hypothetical protein F4775DRAFT_537336 [Biscogniauxia sp. FL1348]
MVVQLPAEVLGIAIWVLCYSTFSLLCSLLLIWLVWAHHERNSYVALLSYFTCLSTAASIAQQIHTIVWWRDVKIEQYEHSIMNLGRPEIAIAGPSVGVDLVLFYIQFYSYNVESMLVFFWAGALTQSVFQFTDLANFKSIRHKTNLIAKVLAVLVPILFVSLLRLDSVQSSYPAFLVLANVTMVVSLTLGSTLLAVILVRYIYTRRRLLPWNICCPCSRNSQGIGHNTICSISQSHRCSNIYDRWLVVRFTIAFVLLGVFQVATISTEVSQLRNGTREMLGDEPNLSTSRATTDFVLFMPGVSTGLVLFIVFGTTRTFRDKMYRTFIPKRFQRREETHVAITAPSNPTEENLNPGQGRWEDEASDAMSKDIMIPSLYLYPRTMIMLGAVPIPTHPSHFIP